MYEDRHGSQMIPSAKGSNSSGPGVRRFNWARIIKDNQKIYEEPWYTSPYAKAIIVMTTILVFCVILLLIFGDSISNHVYADQYQ